MSHIQFNLLYVSLVLHSKIFIICFYTSNKIYNSEISCYLTFLKFKLVCYVHLKTFFSQKSKTFAMPIFFSNTWKQIKIIFPKKEQPIFILTRYNHKYSKEINLLSPKRLSVTYLNQPFQKHFVKNEKKKYPVNSV